MMLFANDDRILTGGKHPRHNSCVSVFHAAVPVADFQSTIITRPHLLPSFTLNFK